MQTGMEMSESELKILVVDDDPDILTAVSAVIEERMPQAILFLAEDGKKGLALAGTEEPDVILLDIVLPGLTGYAVCRKLKEDERLRDIPVVFMTAHRTDRESRITALDAGAESFLVKPFEESELLAQIRTMAKIRAGHLRQRSEQGRLAALVADRTHQLEAELAERAKIEQELRTSEQRYRLLVENSREIVFALDPRGVIDFLSASAVTLLGYDIAKLVGSTFDTIIHPEDKTLIREMFRRSLEEGYESAGTEFRLRHASGEWRWFVARGNALRASDGQPITFTGIASDITERKEAELRALASDQEARTSLALANQSRLALLSMVEDIRSSKEQLLMQEERLRMALSAAKQGLFDLNVQTGVAWVSPEYATMIGYEPGEFRESQEMWLERLHPDDRGLAARTYDRYIAGELPEYRIEFRQKCKDGSWKWMLSVGKVVEWDAHGTPVRMLGSHTDIDANKAMEQSLRESSQRMRSLTRKLQDIREQERRELALEIHDELGQVLTAVKMDIGLMERVLEGWGKAYLSSLLPERVVSLKSLADQAIATTRQLTTRLRPEVLDRLGFGSAIDWLVEHWTQRSGIACRVTIDSHLREISDPLAITLFRVTQEGLTNIAKHARASSASIRLDHEPRGILFEIGDDGVGMSGEASRKDSFGLLGVRERVEALDGTLAIITKPGGGTLLRVEIPLVIDRREVPESLVFRLSVPSASAEEG